MTGPTGAGIRQAAVPLAVAVALPIAFTRTFGLAFGLAALAVSAVLMFVAVVVARDASRRPAAAKRAAAIMENPAPAELKRPARRDVAA